MPSKTIRIQHASGFVFDTTRNQVEDANAIFSTGAHVMSGTEAGPGAQEFERALRNAARREGYLLYRPAPQDCWVAIHKDLWVRGTKVKKGCPMITGTGRDNGDPHPYSAKGIPWMQVMTPMGLPLTMTGGHWLTKGRFPGQAKQDNPRCKVDHYAVNTEYGQKTARLMTRKCQTGGWAFTGSDTNLIDRVNDVFRGGAVTTAWDLMKNWPDTGHGNIDVIGVADACLPRAKCLSARIADLDLNSDHRPIEAKFRLTWKAAK